MSLRSLSSARRSQSLARHIKGNAVAYLALFVALGGTGYAAVELPPGSVGASQIRNHVIEPVKLNPDYIDGNVRVWASVSATGRVVAGGTGVTVTPQGEVPGDYIIEPSRESKLALPRKCAALTSVDDSSSQPGYAAAQVVAAPAGEMPRWDLVVQVFGSSGAHAALPFDVAVLC